MALQTGRFDPDELGRRIVVVGPPGSGKTTTAAILARRLGLRRVELDALYWGPNWTPSDQFRERVEAAVAGPAWVVDGNYFSVAANELVWPYADTVVWLDLPRHVIIGRVAKRSLIRSLRRSPLWAGNRETIRKAFFDRDALLRYAWAHHGKYRQRYLPMMRAGQPPNVRWLRFTSSGTVRRWLASLGRHERETMGSA